MFKLKTVIILMSVIILLSHCSFIGKTAFFGLNISDSRFSTHSSQFIVTINQTFGGPLLDYSYSVISTSDGGHILAGYTYSYGVGESDMWLVKTNTLGQYEWDQTIGGPYGDYGFAIIEVANGGFLIVGGTASYGAGDYDMWLVKTNITGQTEWTQTIGGTRADFCFSVVESSDGEYILAGRTESYGAGGTDMWLVKTNAVGQIIWNHTFGGTANDFAASVIAASDGGYVLAGGSESYGVGGMDIRLVKTDANGQVEWNQSFGGVQEDMASAITSTSDGGFVVAGLTQSYGAGDRDVWLIKTNGTGHPEWNHTFGGMGSDSADCVITTSDEAYVFTGRTESYGAGESDIWIVKTTATGHSEWNHTFGGTEEEAAYSVIATSDEGYIVVGRTESYGTGESDTWLIKIIVQSETIQTTMTSHSSTVKSSTSSSSRSIPGMSGVIVICIFVILIMMKKKSLSRFLKK